MDGFVDHGSEYSTTSGGVAHDGQRRGTARGSGRRRTALVCDSTTLGLLHLDELGRGWAGPAGHDRIKYW